MFETSSILSMLGMGVQLKGAAQNSITSPGVTPAMQAGMGVELQLPQAADQNATVFQLMLSFALPNSGAALAQASPAAIHTDDSASTSITLPFKVKDSDTKTDNEEVTASPMMPFYPVQWDAVSAALQLNQAAAATQGTETPTAATSGVLADMTVQVAASAAAGSTAMKQQQATGVPVGQGTAAVAPMMNQTLPAAQNAAGNAEITAMMKQSQQAAQNAEADAAIAGMIKQQTAGSQPPATPGTVNVEQKNAPAAVDATANKTSSAAQTMAEVALLSALGGERVKETLTVQSEQQTAARQPAQTPVAENTQPVQARAAALPATQTVASGEKIIDVNAPIAAALQSKLAAQGGAVSTVASIASIASGASVPAAPAAGQPVHQEIVTNTIPSQLSSEEAVVQNNSAAAKNSDVTIPVTVSQHGEGEPFMLNSQQGNMAESTAAWVVASQTLPADNTSVPVAAIGQSAAATAAPAAAPHKFNAAHAWAESVIRKITASQTGTGTTAAQKTDQAAQTSSGEPVVVKGNETGAVVQKMNTAVEHIAAQLLDANAPVQQTQAQVQQKILSAPETQVKLHEIAARAADTETMKPLVKTSAGAASGLKARTEEAAGVVAQTSSEKTAAAPAPDVSVTAAPKTREDVPVLAKPEIAADVRAVKVDVPTQQPLVNVADVQRQFVPLHEAAPVLTQRVRDDVFEKIFKEVSNIKHTPTSVDVTLSPGSLGTVTVKVGLEEGKMAARIDVQNIEVKHIIESNMPKLQEVLQSNGLSLDSIGVFVNNGSSFAEKRQEASKKKMNGTALKIDDGFEPLSTLRDSKQYGYNTVEYIM